MKSTGASGAPLPDAIIKMEDRKRAAGQSLDDVAPPSKRQVNGNSKVSADSDMPWKYDIEQFQKDALYRQLQEYKRDKATLELELKDTRKRATDHDDHLRIVDAWWSQLLDEVTLLAKNTAPDSFTIDDPFPTALRFKNSTEFSSHLTSKAKYIKEKINTLLSSITFAKGHESSTEVAELQDSLTQLLASQKEQMVKFDRLQVEKDLVSERLETASLRMLKAEKKLDRTRSAVVARLEAQNGVIGAAETKTENREDTQMENGIPENSAKSEELDAALKEATAVSNKQQEQLASLAAENRSLTEQLTAATARFATLNEDDYARTDLFKTLKAQHEDVIKRINHLEATNIQLREEAEKLQAERTTYRVQVQDEADASTTRLEQQLQQTEADLSRIRSSRDELLADQTIRRASQDQGRTAINHMKELMQTSEERITSLEAEIQRLQKQVEQDACEPTPRADIDNLEIEELRQKYKVLEENFTAVNNELPAMEKLYKRSMAASSAKVLNFSALEERVAILIAEKNKADQKYFAARKDMENRINEVRALRAHNQKNTEIISQLKEVEAQNRILCSGLEKQLSELRQANVTAVSQAKKSEAAANEAVLKLDTFKGQVQELSQMLKAKDANSSGSRQRVLALEADIVKLQTRLDREVKEKESLKSSRSRPSSETEAQLRLALHCSVCRNVIKNVMIKTCGHLFCSKCVEDRLANRMRKCPSCSKAFDKSDLIPAHM